MNPRLASGLALVLGCLLPVEGRALSQGKHRDLSVSACWAQKLPAEFCNELGAAAYNVDHYEWSDLSAHAQPEAGEPKCQAANKAVARVRSLAQEMRAIAKAQTDYDPALAVALGRALHTIQDNCAHAGMPNPEHAWFSLSDTCADTELSPDVKPEALACAEAQTEQALALFAAEIQVPAPPPPPEPGQARVPPQYWPKRGDVCDFLKSASSWDGVDRRWNNAPVVAALADQLHATLVVDAAAPALDVCAGGQAVLEPTTPAADVDVSQPTEWCTALDVYCAGKVDSADDAPPWEAKGASGGSERSSEGSCNLGASERSGPIAGIAVAVALLAALRRRGYRAR